MNNSNYKVSVVVPVYNVENYLEECLENLRKQTYRNIEIIMVNDGSTDKSEVICLRYAEQDKRFILISQENKGVSIARNVGIERATGKWIVFADADDYYYEDGIEKMVDLVCKSNQKVALCNSDIEGKNVTKTLLLLQDSYESFFLPMRHYALWGYIFALDLMRDNSVWFVPKLEFSEDRLFLYELSFYTIKMAVSHESVYFHRTNNSSMCNSSSGIRKARGQLNAAIELKKLRTKKDYNNIVAISIDKEIMHVVRMALLQYFSLKIKLSEIIELYNIYSKNIGCGIFFLLNAILQFVIANKRKFFG